MFMSTPLQAIIAPGLCMPLILGLPLLMTNKVICNYVKHQCLATTSTPPYDLMTLPLLCITSCTNLPNVITAVLKHIQTLTLDDELTTRENELWSCFATVFEPPSHFNELPQQPLAHIRLKDLTKEIKGQNYPCPWKWKDMWHTLLQQHLDVGCIHPSSAPAGSGAFIIPKANLTVLPQWVNDYWQLNSNTITDSFPIPHVNDILSNLATGQYFVTIDMTNSFFQTRMHPDDVTLT